MSVGHPTSDPHDGRQECLVCGKFVWSAIHSCKGFPVTEAARRRMRETMSTDPYALTEDEERALFSPTAQDPPLTDRDAEAMESLRSVMDGLTAAQKATLSAVVVEIANTRAQRGLDAIREQITETTRGLPEDKSVLDVEDIDETIEAINDEYADAIDEAFGLRIEHFGDW